MLGRIANLKLPTAVGIPPRERGGGCQDAAFRTRKYMIPARRLLRLIVLVLLVMIALTTAVQSAAPGDSGAGSADAPRNDTVYTVDATGPYQLTAVSPNGSVRYHDRYNIYHDVDPVPAAARTVLYVASDMVGPNACAGPSKCIRNVVHTINLTTNSVTRLYSTVGPRNGSSQFHDVDRVNESVLLVADIGPPDRVYMVNVTTGQTLWEWRVDEAYEPESGGAYPEDWTHLNEVAMLDDGRVLVNLRNQDQVVFIRPGEGILEEWTLGCDGCHETLYEQHNPDYIPAERGGPALLVADSENNRVVEYQRTEGEWNRSWTWNDSALQWPRDADRLPNGNTLIADSHGGRILEVNRSGTVVWQHDVPDGVYDVERLGTGDESAGGLSANRLRYETHGEDKSILVTVVPNIVLHGVLWALPTWVAPVEAGALLIAGVSIVFWLIGEAGFAVYARYT
jgi:outer membrane protein assembly factor BamB